MRPVEPAVILLSNATGTSAAKGVLGGWYQFIVSGTFSTQTVKLQLPAADGTYVDVDNGSVSASGTKLVYLPPGQVKAVATATAVYASLVRIPQD